MAPLALHYFPLAGRAEVARLLLHTATKPVEWKDERHTFEDWQSLKPKVPFGQLPVFELDDGSFLAESSAVDRTGGDHGRGAGRRLGVARSDEAYAFMEDVWMTLAPTMRIKDEAEKLKARKEAAEGPLAGKLALLDKLLGGLGGDKWFSGLDRPSYADYAVFKWLSVKGIVPVKRGGGRTVS